MGVRPWIVVLAGLVVAGCGGAPGPCGAPYVVGVYDDPGPYDVGGWYYVGDDGSGDYTGDDGSGGASSGDDGTADGTDPSAGDTSGASGDDSSSTGGDDSSGSTGDDSSGDDGSDCLKPGHFARRSVHHRARRRREGGASAAAMRAQTVRVQTAPATVVGAGPDGCYSCALSCVLTAPRAGQANAATAIGGSDVGFDDACSNAQSELATWAHDQGTTLEACRVGAAPLATQAASPPSSPAGVPRVVDPFVPRGVSRTRMPRPSGAGGPGVSPPTGAGVVLPR